MVVQRHKLLNVRSKCIDNGDNGMCDWAAAVYAWEHTLHRGIGGAEPPGGPMDLKSDCVKRSHPSLTSVQGISGAEYLIRAVMTIFMAVTIWPNKYLWYFVTPITSLVPAKRCLYASARQGVCPLLPLSRKLAEFPGRETS